MEIKPVKRYPSPTYPTRPEVDANPELLAHLPSRWTSPTKSLVFLGLVGLLSKGLAGDAADAKDRVEITQSAEDKKTPPADRNAQKKDAVESGAVIAPILAEALNDDGRGAFGCIVMNPPTFLPEDEALEIIMKELDANGFKYKKKLTVKDVPVPLDPYEMMELDDMSSEPEGNEPKAKKRARWKTKKGAFQFDLASEDESIVIEYFSRDDHRKWIGSNSTVYEYDFPNLLEGAKELFSTSKQPRTFGFFFDPLVHNQVDQPDTDGLEDPALIKRAREEYGKAIVRGRSKAKTVAEDKLREQVRHFVKYLREQGVVPKKD